MAYTTIDDPSAHFQATIYVGSGSDDLVVTNVGNSDLQPDFIWIKKRSASGQHVLSDTSRGILKVLNSNGTAAEDSNSEGEMIKSVQSDGFTLGDSQAGQGDTNYTSGGTYVAWQWKANGGSRTTFAESGDNPAGGRQVNATAGFSLIDYTGTGATGTIAHGLGAKPDFWVIKNRGGGGWSWYAYHGSNTSAPETELLYMNNTDATLDTDAVWNDTAPTSSVFTVNTNGGVNDDDDTYICYLFTSIQGYSKFGGYTGNGNADGAFNYTGFKPALIIIKCTSTASTDWVMYDNKRDINPVGSDSGTLYPNLTDGDSSAGGIDFLSNGFKSRSTNGYHNGSSRTYIYMAFAESPFVTSGGVPCTAR
jgi:hypothetical protein